MRSITADEHGHAFIVDKSSCVGAANVAVSAITHAGVLKDGTRLALEE